MTLSELKASAYDALSNVEYWQLKLREINQQIANYKEPEQATAEEKE